MDKPGIEKFLKTAQALRIHRSEVRAATLQYKGVEVGEAHRLWKLAHGQKPVRLSTGTTQKNKEQLLELTEEMRKRACTRSGCSGTQALEPICAGCVEGKAGYKTKWTCLTCLHRDLSRDTMLEWISKLS